MRFIVGLLLAGLVGGCPEFEDGGECGDGYENDDLGSGRTETCDDGNTRDGDGCSARCRLEPKISAVWAFESLAGTRELCPAGFDTARVIVYSQPPTSATFDCSPLTGSFRLELEGYSKLEYFDMSVSIENSTTGAVWAESPRNLVKVSAAGAAFSRRFYSDAGHYGLRWQFIQFGERARCFGIEQSMLDVTLTPTAGGAPIVHAYPCSDLELGSDPDVLSPPVPVGSYTIDVSNAGQSVLTLGDQMIAAPSGVLDLGEIFINVPF